MNDVVRVSVAQMQEFQNSLKQAADDLRARDDVVVALRARIDDLETRMASLASDSRIHLTAANHGYGFTDAAMAKQFMEVVRDIFQQTVSTKTAVEGSDPDGGYVVPTEFRTTLLSLIEQYGLIRNRATIVPMRSNELVMPKLAGGVSVYWLGETEAVPETRPSFGEFRLAVKKLGAAVPLSSELLEDSSIEMANLIATLFAQASAREEDRVGFVGDISGAADPFNGVLYDPGVTAYVMASTKTAFTDIDADMLEEVASSKSSAGFGGMPEWYMHRTIFSIVRRLKYSGSGEYIYADPVAPGEPGTIWGYPVNLVEVMPAASASGTSKPFIFFGDMRNMYMGDRASMAIARNDSLGFLSDKVYVRALERIGFQYALPETGTAITTAAS